MLTLDGARGEGGGQIVRTALALSIITSTPFRIHHVRAGREKPGLRRQHLTAVRAAAEISGGRVDGAEVGSREFTFTPGPAVPGNYRFDVGTAGSTTLVLQTVLPPLLLAGGPSSLHIQGGTHNAWAPPFEFIRRTFLPLLGRMGPRVEAVLERPGFYPAGGGHLRVDIGPVKTFTPLEIVDRPGNPMLQARALVAKLPVDIAQRELDVLTHELGIPGDRTSIERDDRSLGPGNVAMVELVSDRLTEVYTAVGKRGLRAEDVAKQLAAEVRAHLETGAPVGPHLADQLLIPMALAGSGAIRTGPLTLHSTTNMDTISAFLPLRFSVKKAEDSTLVVSL